MTIDEMIEHFYDTVEDCEAIKEDHLRDFFEYAMDDALRDQAQAVVDTFERLYGPASVDIGDSYDVEKLRAVVMALRDAL